MVNKLLEEKRNELKMTQEEVADKAGITRAYYSMIEAGKKTPSPKSPKESPTFLISNGLFFTHASNKLLHIEEDMKLKIMAIVLFALAALGIE